MPNPPSTRSVKIGQDERGGWSSDRPRPDGAPARPPSLATRCRLLSPSDRLRYSPGSLLMVVSASQVARDQFVARLIEDKASVFSVDKVRGLLAGRVPAEEMDARIDELLRAAVGKRLEAGETVVVPAEGLAPESREPWVRMAAGHRRPRHVILVEGARDDVDDADRAALNALRKALDAGELGAEGFQTALRLGGASVAEVKRIVFQPPPRDD
jgi:hypothetical protein